MWWSGHARVRRERRGAGAAANIERGREVVRVILGRIGLPGELGVATEREVLIRRGRTLNADTIPRVRESAARSCDILRGGIEPKLYGRDGVLGRPIRVRGPVVREVIDGNKSRLAVVTRTRARARG